MKVDLRNCNVGDELLSRGGKTFYYAGRTTSDNYPHKISEYPVSLELYGTRTDSGQTYAHDNGHYCGDIVEIRKPEIKTGDKVLVSDNGDHWEEMIYLYTHPHSNKHMCVHGGLNEKSWIKDVNVTMCRWSFIKPITEPFIEITVKINGKESKLSDVSDETLKKIKENE